jgi:YegS/Rv2252/BmrU family lipid kinase
MSASGLRAVMIVNPASDSGRTARAWSEIARRAAEHGLTVEPRLTEGPGHATELTRRALRDGARLIVTVGGDGTVSEAVNGFYEGTEAVAPDAELAVIERGSGCDFARTFRIPKKTDAALRVAATGRPRTIDLGRVSYTGLDGAPGSRLYCNVASAGLTGVVAERVNRSGKPLGATVAFAWGAMATFFGYRNGSFRVRIDERELDQVCNNVIVANCRYFAGGMKILPMAEPDDGLLDVLVWGDVGKLDLAMNLHRLYRGTHTNHPKGDFSRARHVVVEPATPLPIEADGELPGMTPATFDVVPAAIRLRTPA